MNNNLLTINRYLDVSDSVSLIEEMRLFIRRAKEINPKLKEYQLYDIGFIPKADLILVKLYFFTLKK